MQDWWQDAQECAQEVIRSLGPRRCTAANWTYETIQYKIDGPLASVKLNDVRGANGLSLKTTSALTDIAVELHGRPDVKVVVFTAGGAYFCTGGAFGGNTADDDYLYGEQPEFGLTELEQQVRGNLPTAKLFYLINVLPQYKVAAIRGRSMGAGNSLIASMDFVYAPATKKCGLSFLESTRALSFCMSWQGILSKVGIPKARGLVLISEEVDVYGGKDAGIIDQIVEGASAEGAMRAADELAAAKGAEVAQLPTEEIRKLKTTGPGGTRTKLLEVPTAARGCQALQGQVPDYQGAIAEVIAKCGRSGRPAAARLSKELWEHSTVQLERCGQHTAVLRLADGQAHNKLSRATLHGLLDAAIELHKSAGKVRLLSVYADGKSFCSGLDESVPADDEQLQQMLFLFWMLPMYVEGFLEGKVSGHGIAFCGAFDSIVAKSSVEFDFTGLTTQHGGEFVSARVGVKTLEDLVRTKSKRTAEEVEALGFSVRLVKSKQEMQERLEYVCERLSQCAPNAVAESKPVLQTVGTTNVDSNLLTYMATHIGKRSLDPEFNDAILAITVPTHKPVYNRHEHSAVLPEHKAPVGGEPAGSDAPLLLKDRAPKVKKGIKAMAGSVMI